MRGAIRNLCLLLQGVLRLLLGGGMIHGFDSCVVPNWCETEDIIKSDTGFDKMGL